MELYYKDLISKEASLDELVDNMMLVVQGADEFAQAAGANSDPAKKQEIAQRLERLKEGCRKVKRQTKATAVAADKLLHEYPYCFAGISLVAGLLVGALVMRCTSCRDRDN